MSNPVVSSIKGCIGSLIIAANTLILTCVMIPFALAKLVLPSGSLARRIVDRVLNALADTWVRINGLWIALLQKVRWDVEGTDTLRKRGWYLVSSNHQSWVDILVLQKIFQDRIPFLKFFLKQELIYVPVIGLAWWALDFPFMRRGKGAKSGRSDLAATRKACERFKTLPTSVMNFLEGTRLTAAKHSAQRSPYKNLLKPKIGGLSIALATMGEQFDSMLDVTILYPHGVPTFWDILSGGVHEVRVRVREIAIPRDLIDGDYERDAAFRARVQAWVHTMWQEKDLLLEELKREASQSAV
ncbi:acyltransferase [Niveibacterium terrae]|uniref:acyltransferase n=1 Tax=Niveibacterium terrae TaxID=3373598 RepID=UPI003A94FC9C